MIVSCTYFAICFVCSDPFLPTCHEILQLKNRRPRHTMLLTVPRLSVYSRYGTYPAQLPQMGLTRRHGICS